MRMVQAFLDPVCGYLVQLPFPLVHVRSGYGCNKDIFDYIYHLFMRIQ